MNKFQMISFVLRNTVKSAHVKSQWFVKVRGSRIFSITKLCDGYNFIINGELRIAKSFMGAIAAYVNNLDSGTICKLVFINNELKNIDACNAKIKEVKYYNENNDMDLTVKVLADESADELAVNMVHHCNGTISWRLTDLWEATTFLTWATGHDMRMKTGMNFQRMLDLLPLLRADVVRRSELVQTIADTL